MVFDNGVSNSISITDNLENSFKFGSTGRTDLLRLDTRNEEESVIVKGQ